MVAEVRPDYETEWAAMKAVASKLGIGTADGPLVLKPRHTLGGELPTPLANRLHTGADSQRGTRVRHPVSARQDDAGPLSRTPIRQPGPAQQFVTLVLGKNDRSFWSINESSPRSTQAE
jgi:hypothetical protein